MKEFYGRASIIIDLCFNVKADSIEEAEEKVLGAEMLEFELLDAEGKKVLEDYETNDWYVIDKCRQGNIRESGIHNFEIAE